MVAADAAGRPARRCASVIVGGEALPPAALRGACCDARPPAAAGATCYGPTETTVHVTCAHGARRGAAAAPVPDRRARSPTRALYVLDAALRPVPVGVRGRAVPGRRRGGARLPGPPGAHRRALRPRPVRREPGARLYRTGDRVRWRADGDAGVPGPAGRAGEGPRLPHRAGRGRGGAAPPPRRARVRAWWCARTAGRAAAGGLRGRRGADARPSCARTCARSAAGVHGARRLRGAGRAAAHAQRQARPQGAPRARAARPAARYVAPRTPVEEVLAEIWAEVLGVERVGVRRRLLRRWAGTRCWPRAWSRASARCSAWSCRCARSSRRPRWPELAARGGGAAPRRRAACCRRSSRSAATAPLPLSFAQERLWFLRPAAARTAPSTTSRARCGWTARSTRPRWSARWARSCAGTRRCAPPSREVDGAPVQVVAPLSRLRAAGGRPVGAASPPSARPRWSAGRTDEAARPFDLAAGPLFRARLLRLGADEHVLLLTMHHVVSDGWSTGRALPRAVRRCTTRSAAGASRRCPSCRCSTPTTPCGSASSCAATRWSGSWPTGASGWPARPRCWSCPPTIRARRCRRFRGAYERLRPVAPRWLGRLRALARARGRHAVHGAAGRLPGRCWRRYAGERRRGGGHAHRRAHPRARWRS